jgi:hypothetical protein
MKLSLNWKTFDERTVDFCQGITLHHLPGHTDGLIGMQLNLPESGAFFFISDHCHVIENVSQEYRNHVVYTANMPFSGEMVYRKVGSHGKIMDPYTPRLSLLIFSVTIRHGSKVLKD